MRQRDREANTKVQGQLMDGPTERMSHGDALKMQLNKWLKVSRTYLVLSILLVPVETGQETSTEDEDSSQQNSSCGQMLRIPYAGSINPNQ